VSAVTVTPDGRCALWGSSAGALLVWDLQIGETVRVLEGHADWVTAVAITPDGRRGMSASAGGTLRLWDVETGNRLAAFTGEGPVLRCAIAPDGRTIVAREKSGRGHFLRLEGL